MTSSAGHVYGVHAVAALLAQRPASIKKLLLASGAKNAQLDTLIENTVAAGVAMQVQSRAELDALIPGARHQGVIAVENRCPEPARSLRRSGSSRNICADLGVS